MRADALGLKCSIGVCHAIGCGNYLRPAANASGDRFLGGELFLPVSLGRGLNRVRGLENLDPLGYFKNARPFVFSRLLGRTGKTSLELVPQSSQFGQVRIVGEWLAVAGLVVAELQLRDSVVSLGSVAFGAVTARQTLQGVEKNICTLMFTI